MVRSTRRVEAVQRDRRDEHGGYHRRREGSEGFHGCCSLSGVTRASRRVARNIQTKTPASALTRTRLTVKSETGGVQPSCCASSYAATATAKMVTDQIHTRITWGNAPPRYETIRWMKSESSVSVQIIPAQNIDPTASAPKMPASAPNATAYVATWLDVSKPKPKSSPMGIATQGDVALRKASGNIWLLKPKSRSFWPRESCRRFRAAIPSSTTIEIHVPALSIAAP